MDINEKLLDNGIFYLYGEIQAKTWNIFNESIEYLESIGSPDLTIKIKTPGGRVDVSKDICLLIKRYSGKTTGIVHLTCNSGGFSILQSCDYRISSSDAFILPHLSAKNEIDFEQYFGERFTVKKMKSVLKNKRLLEKMLEELIEEGSKIDNEIIDFYLTKCSLNRKQLVELLEAEKKVDPNYLLEIGFLDQIDNPFK